MNKYKNKQSSELDHVRATQAAVQVVRAECARGGRVCAVRNAQVVLCGGRASGSRQCRCSWRGGRRGEREPGYLRLGRRLDRAAHHAVDHGLRVGQSAVHRARHAVLGEQLESVGARHSVLVDVRDRVHQWTQEDLRVVIKEVNLRIQVYSTCSYVLYY